MSNSQIYTTILRLVYEASSETMARMIAEAAAEKVAAQMDEGDDVRITSVVNTDNLVFIPEEIATKLDAARNALIMLKFTDTWDIARALDQFSHHLRHGSLADYNAGNIFVVAKQLDKVREKSNA